MTVKKQTKQSADQGFGAMEYFLLALIGRAGLTSLYTLQQRAGLQPGGIRPALRRLEKGGFLAHAQPSARRRRNLSLTARGVSFLNDTWKQGLSDYADAESVLRAACVAMLMGDREYASDYLLGQSLTRQSAGKEKNMEAERLQTGRLDPLSTYAWMRALTEAQRREGESNAFSKLGRTLKEHHQPDVVQPRQ